MAQTNRARRGGRDEVTDPSTTGGASSQGTSTATQSTATSASGSAPQAQQQSSETRNAGGGIAQKIREQANTRLSSGKDRALDGVGGVTDALRHTSQSLRDSQHDTIAKYLDEAVAQVDRVAQNLRQKDIGELMVGAQRLARRRPAMFVGSAFAIGVLAARFFKSSPPDQPDHYEDARYGSDYRTRGMSIGSTETYPRQQPESEFRGFERG